jgi:hypothetical protein
MTTKPGPLLKNRPPVKVKWTTEEDQFLLYLVRQLRQKNWMKIAAFMRNRNAWQCRE